MKISVDGVFVRLDELQLQKAIRLSELPFAEKIRAVYQTIGSKTEAPRAVGYKRKRLQEDGGPTSRQKKASVTYEELDFEKNLQSNTWCTYHTSPVKRLRTYGTHTSIYLPGQLKIHPPPCLL